MWAGRRRYLSMMLTAVGISVTGCDAGADDASHGFTYATIRGMSSMPMPPRPRRRRARRRLMAAITIDGVRLRHGVSPHAPMPRFSLREDVDVAATSSRLARGVTDDYRPVDEGVPPHEQKLLASCRSDAVRGFSASLARWQARGVSAARATLPEIFVGWGKFREAGEPRRLPVMPDGAAEACLLARFDAGRGARRRHYRRGADAAYREAGRLLFQSFAVAGAVDGQIGGDFRRACRLSAMSSAKFHLHRVGAHQQGHFAISPRATGVGVGARSMQMGRSSRGRWFAVAENFTKSTMPPE